MPYMKRVAKSFLGTSVARQTKKRSHSQVEMPFSGLTQLMERAPSVPSDDSPIFILSAGWRSGSTLLQRLICSDQETLLWGEPYDLCGIVQSLARLPQPITSEWPSEDYLISGHDQNKLTTSWIANLYPDPTDFRDALRAMLHRMFAKPAAEIGAKRWGLKEVRFGLEEAVFLHWLFPNAKFLMIYRDVEDAFRSYQHFSPAMNWYGAWPDQPVFTPFAFARHRQRLLKQFPEIAKQTGGLIISYEELTQGTSDLEEISHYCGIEIDPGILNTRVQGRNKTKVLTQERLSWMDKTLLHAGSAYEARKAPPKKLHEVLK